MCCYREIKNFDRFIRLTQSIVLCTLQQLQVIQQNEQQEDVAKEMSKDDKDEEERGNKRKSGDNAEHAQGIQTKQIWSQHDKEKLFLLLSKIFLLNFPLYIAMKHGGVINPLAPVKVKLVQILLLKYYCLRFRSFRSFYIDCFVLNRMKVVTVSRMTPKYQRL